MDLFRVNFFVVRLFFGAVVGCGVRFLSINYRCFSNDFISHLSWFGFVLGQKKWLFLG